MILEKLMFFKLLLSFLFCVISLDVFANTQRQFSFHVDSCEPYFVGELGEAWQFPSDHLPVRLELGSFALVCWNILNKDYLNYIEMNTQGLRESSILKDHRLVEGQTLTVRENMILSQIFEMMQSNSLIALQETHEDVFHFLCTHLPPGWDVITPPGQVYSQDIFLYNCTEFDFVGIDAEFYTPGMPKTIFTLTLLEKSSAKLYRFIQSHIPGGPIQAAAGCAKFAEASMRQFDPSMTMVLMGDMNQPPAVIQAALEKVAQGMTTQPFKSIAIPYPTHVNTNFEAAWFDHYFVHTPEESPEIKASEAKAVLKSLVPVVDLLKSRF
jgi:hypothetical protein